MKPAGEGPLASSRVYDLSAISSVLWKKWLRTKWVGNIAAVVLLALFAGLELYDSLRAISQGQYLYPGRVDLVLFGFFAAMGAALFWASHFVSPPARRVVVGDGSIRIEFPWASPKTLAWSDPMFRLRISRTFSFSLNSELSFSQFWWKPRLYMPLEASSAIVQEARAAGMTVTTPKDPNSTTGVGVLIRARAGRSPSGTPPGV
ncbi:MAG TPA: hypothetical protein VEH57_06275 [Thermoplasmata archaeon]|nr:hypothetical protein [Thermoplasmata archaeon]